MQKRTAKTAPESTRRRRKLASRLERRPSCRSESILKSEEEEEAVKDEIRVSGWDMIWCSGGKSV